MVVCPSFSVNLSSSGQVGKMVEGWTEVLSRKNRRVGYRSLDRAVRSPTPRSDRRGAFNASAGREAFLSQFRGKCFRCLNKCHCRVDCRDPLRYIICKRAGHFSKECPQNPRNGGPGGAARARLGPAAAVREPVRDRLVFPPRPPPARMDRPLLCDPARRPRNSNKVIMSSPALEHEEFILRQHAVTLTAADRSHSTSPMAVGRAILEQLTTPPHQLRVTAHQPEAFLVHSDLPAHRDDAVHRGILKVDGCKYFIRAWHEDDHAAILKCNHHVRVVVEDLPMQFWSLPGAEEALGDVGRVDRLDTRTLERGHTKTFSCWLWVWDVAHIPTKRALWVLKRGAGRVDEIIGFAPPDCRVPPPPGVRRYDLLVHVDLVEDWTPLSPRSSHSGQSGLPSSDENDDRPFPRIEPGSWVARVEDGQGGVHRGAPRVGASGCGPILRGGARDQEDGGGSGGSGRSWRDRLLGRGCHDKGSEVDVVEGAQRQRSRTPVGRHHAASGRGRSAARKDDGARAPRVTPLFPLLQVPILPPEEDPVAQFFFSDSGRALSPPPRTDCMQLEMENAMIEALNTPLAFEDGGPSPSRQEAGPVELESLEMLSCLLPCINSPVAATVGFQMEAVTQRVGAIQISSSQAVERTAGLFTVVPPLVLPCQQPRPRHSAPPKSRATSAPSRRSARQAAAANTTLVAQRAVLRLVQELGELGPKDKMTSKRRRSS